MVIYLYQKPLIAKISGPSGLLFDLSKKSRGETHGSRLDLNAREANVFLDTEACSKIFGTDASGITQPCRWDGPPCQEKTGDSLRWSQPAAVVASVDGLGHPHQEA